MTADVKFIHLRCHSAYSLLEGGMKIGKILDLAKADAQPALGLTDSGNLFGALEFSDKAASCGIQPLIGCQIRLALAGAVQTDDFRRNNSKAHGLVTLVLIAMDQEGYANLVALVSRSFLDTGSDQEAHITLEHLTERQSGLICLSGGRDGPIDRMILDHRPDEARARARLLKALFGDRFYIELQRLDLADEAMREPALLDIAYDLDIPIVATNEPFFATEADYEAHDALICIAEGSVLDADDRRRLSSACHFKSQSAMCEMFADLPEALVNTVEIARRCHVLVEKRAPILPQFAADGLSGDEAVRAEAAVLRTEARAGLKARLAVQGCAADRTEKDYTDRLEFELDVIENMKFPGYFLIVADFIRWAKSRKIPVGPGRGSGAGSVVAWSLTITDLDPLRFSLLFERFLNPERISMPDFDIDFCQERRDEVIRYVQERYGRDHVAQIITFGTLQARAVMRDVGRVLQMPYGQVDRLCKLVPNNPANPVSLADAVLGEPKLQEARKEEIVDRLIATSLKLEGLYRHASTHAAGIVIGDRSLEKLVPLYRDPRSDMPVTQFNMKWVEQAGLVKFDFLGLKTLTVLQKALELLERRGVTIDLGTLPLDDAATYAMLARGESVGVFQLESQGMRKALIGMQPDQFEDIIALVALYRPGPMDNIPIYNDRKHGREKPDYIHPKIEKYLTETQGVIIYQEQVMQIAQELAGYSLGEADMLRRAMGKKIREEMEAQRARFVNGAQERGLTRAKANEIFDLLAKFANYGFNKSHAAAYALVAYQTAYLKANYPVEFLAASMTLDMGNTDKLSDFKREAERLNISVEIPNINKSHVEFQTEGNTIFYALAAIKGVGAQAVHDIVAARREGGFADLADFGSNLDPKSLNKRTLESLISAGAFDTLVGNRAQVLDALEQIMALAARRHEDRATGQNDMFAAVSGPEPIRLREIADFDTQEKLARELSSVGFYLSAHPLDDYASLLGKLKVKPWVSFEEDVRRGAPVGKIAGTIISRQERNTKTGNKMAVLRLSDSSGQYEAVCFSETLAQHRDYLEPGNSVILIVAAENRPEGVNVRIQSVETLDRAAASFSGTLNVFVREAAPISILYQQLPRSPNGNGGTVSFFVVDEKSGREVEIRLSERYVLSPRLAGALKALPGVVDVELQ
ncbi:MAG: DNA polymerase III subunit alpha [Rhizobiales bacterium]|nr:DNA polymerase III subunit alpha [Hyphomicrobiales bacterium]